MTQPPPFKELLNKYDKNKDGLLGTDELPDDFVLINRGGSRGAGDMAWNKFIGPGKDEEPRKLNQVEWETEVDPHAVGVRQCSRE